MSEAGRPGSIQRESIYELPGECTYLATHRRVMVIRSACYRIHALILWSQPLEREGLSSAALVAPTRACCSIARIRGQRSTPDASGRAHAGARNRASDHCSSGAQTQRQAAAELPPAKRGDASVI